MSEAVQAAQHEEHRDDQGSKIGMYLFLFTEIILFGGLFLLYAVYRYNYALEFHHAAEELNVPIGVINTVVLLTSSLTMAMSVSALQRGNKRLAMLLLLLTLPFTLQRGEVWFQLGPVVAYWSGLERALMVALRANLIVGATFALLGTMPVAMLGEALSRMRVPAKLVQLLQLALRYLGVLHDEYQRRGTMFVEGLNRIGLPTCTPRGAFYAFPSIGHIGMSDEEFAEKLLFEEKVAMLPSSSFGEAGLGYVRGAYSTAYYKLEDALVSIERFVGKYS